MAPCVLVDCDVDAADLHLLLQPKVQETHPFISGQEPVLDASRCVGCGRCEELCRFEAIRLSPAGQPGFVPGACEGCGVCAWFCPEKAIEFGPVVNGEWFVSETRFGPMVHAKLGIAEENSGKLVSTVRAEARRLAEQRGLEMVIIDGSPGIGCPVIASITGANLVLIVTEPTLSGKHDMDRVADLTRHFGIPAVVCVNKWDLNPQIADEIESLAGRRRIRIAGRVRYDRAVTAAQLRRLSVVEYRQNGGAEDVRRVWSTLLRELSEANVRD